MDPVVKSLMDFTQLMIQKANGYVEDQSFEYAQNCIKLAEQGIAMLDQYLAYRAPLSKKAEPEVE